MFNFIVKRKPKSFNSWRGASDTKKLGYKRALESSFQQVYPTHTILTYDLYGILYYFFKRDFNHDADNLSKPIWDCLTGFIFMDDKQIRIRIAGTFNLSKDDFSILDFSGLEGKMVADLTEAFDTEDHILYIECGHLNSSHYKFNIE